MATLALDRARELRATPTDVEHLLWQHLRAGRMAGAKFRRQHSIPPYFVDFYCHAHRLVIELDGSQHGEDVDRARTAFLEAKGLTIVRFSNLDVIGTVMRCLMRSGRSSRRRPSPQPLSRRERGFERGASSASRASPHLFLS